MFTIYLSRVLRIGTLRRISLRSYCKIKSQEIVTIDVTVIDGSLTLFSGGIGISDNCRDIRNPCSNCLLSIMSSVWYLCNCAQKISCLLRIGTSLIEYALIFISLLLSSTLRNPCQGELRLHFILSTV